MGQPDTQTLPNFLLKAPQKQTSHRMSYENKQEYLSAYLMICSNWASEDSKCFQWKDALETGPPLILGLQIVGGSK